MATNRRRRSRFTDADGRSGRWSVGYLAQVELQRSLSELVMPGEKDWDETAAGVPDSNPTENESDPQQHLPGFEPGSLSKRR